MEMTEETKNWLQEHDGPYVRAALRSTMEAFGRQRANYEKLIGSTQAGEEELAGTVSNLITGVLTVLDEQGYKTDVIETLAKGYPSSLRGRVEVLVHNSSTRKVLLSQDIYVHHSDDPNGLEGRSPEELEELLEEWAERFKKGLSKHEKA